CCRTGLLAGGAARASLAPGRTRPSGTRYGPGVLWTLGDGFGLGDSQQPQPTALAHRGSS
ncbi:MAG: hypothetical protein ACI80K_001585, partial [Paracoccaceae bacterium]